MATFEKGNGRVQGATPLELSQSVMGHSAAACAREYHRSLWWAWWLRLPTDARRWAISKN